jgi:ribosomal protein S21
MSDQKQYPSNFTIIARPGESIDSLLLRFKKKTKTSRVIINAVEKMSFKKLSVKKREKRNKSIFLQKLNTLNQD